jgi:hypothetical protein
MYWPRIKCFDLLKNPGSLVEKFDGGKLFAFDRRESGCFFFEEKNINENSGGGGRGGREINAERHGIKKRKSLSRDNGDRNKIFEGGFNLTRWFLHR